MSHQRRVPGSIALSDSSLVRKPRKPVLSTRGHCAHGVADDGEVAIDREEVAPP